MRYLPLFLICVLVVTTSSLATPPTTPPADIWLDRAATDIRRALAHPTTNPTDSVFDPALRLVKARGTDADRALLRQAINAPVPPTTNPTDQATVDFSQKIAVATASGAL